MKAITLPRLWFSCTPFFSLYHRDLCFTLMCIGKTEFKF